MRQPNPKSNMRWDACVIGASAGGIAAVSHVLSDLPQDFALAVIVLLHLSEDSHVLIPRLFARKCFLPVQFAEEKLPLERGRVYVGPPGYHLLVEQDETFSFSLEERVNYSRPSIDVLFDSAADVWQNRLVGVVLTGANCDGAEGSLRIHARGGYMIAQDPLEAEAECMPRVAIETGAVHEVLRLGEIGPRLSSMSRNDSLDSSGQNGGEQNR